MISRQHNFLFIHIPKTAGNSIQNVLRHFCEDELISPFQYQDGYERFELFHPEFDIRKHSTFEDYCKQLGEELLSQMYVFSCVRNPFERLFSFYFSPHRGLVNWNKFEFIKLLKTVKPAIDYLAKGKDRSIENISYIMRYEALKTDFDEVRKQLNLTIADLKVLNASGKPNFRDFYDDEIIAQIIENHKEDFEVFGYSTNPY